MSNPRPIEQTTAAAPPAAQLILPARLPFAFAKRHGGLVRDLAEQAAECVCREHASPLALAEAKPA